MARPLSPDPRGLANWMERECEQMGDLQQWREFVQNGIEAPATDIWIDGWQDPETGAMLARCTDNGCGMSPDELVRHLSTIHTTVKGGANHGIGARIAAGPRNPKGVTFASRTTVDGTFVEAAVRLVKKDGIYVLDDFDVEEDGYIVQSDSYAPMDGELARLADNELGTAVILHGTGRGKRSTFDSSLAHRVHRYLSDRYYRLPNDVTIHTYQEYKTDGELRHQYRAVKPFETYLLQFSNASGELEFEDISGLNGTMKWWVVPADLQKKMTGRDYRPSGVGLLTDDEIFDYSIGHLNDFGLLYNAVQKQVIILISIDGSRMDTGRSGVFLPGKSRKKNVPWKRLGQHFADHMPNEIRELHERVTVSRPDLEEDMRKRFGPDYLRDLNPVKVPVRGRRPLTLVGDKPDGEELAAGDEYPEPEDEGGVINPPRKRRSAVRRWKGEDPADQESRNVLPRVEFVPADEMPEGHPYVTWNGVQNVVLVSKDFPPYRREINIWSRDTNHAGFVVEEAVQQAYREEYIGTILDANSQSKHKVGPDLIDQLKSDAALYVKVIGRISMTERILDHLRTTSKVVESAEDAS